MRGHTADSTPDPTASLGPFRPRYPIGPPHIEILDQVYASCSEVVLAYPHTRVIRNLDNR